jgi:hypothetical protein
MDCSSSTVSNTRAAPNAASRPLVTPYTPPLRATSSPNTSMPGRAARASVSVALMACARVIGPADSGSRPPNARRRAASPAAVAAPAATASGRRGASGAITWAALVSRGAPARFAARASTRARDASYRSSTSPGDSRPAPISSRAVPISGSPSRAAAISAGSR